MQSGQKQVVLGKGEKERRERRKEKRKRKKEEKKKKREEKENEKERKGKKGWGKQSEIKKIKKTHGGVSSDSVYFKSLDFPWNWSAQLDSWGGACCADSQVLTLGGAALPLPGAGLSGGCSPREAPGGTTAVAAAALQPWSQLLQ